MLVSRSGPTMLAQIAVMKALNRHVEQLFDPSAKLPITEELKPLGSNWSATKFIDLPCEVYRLCFNTSIAWPR